MAKRSPSEVYPITSHLSHLKIFGPNRTYSISTVSLPLRTFRNEKPTAILTNTATSQHTYNGILLLQTHKTLPQDLQAVPAYPSQSSLRPLLPAPPLEAPPPPPDRQTPVARAGARRSLRRITERQPDFCRHTEARTRPPPTDATRRAGATISGADATTKIGRPNKRESALPVQTIERDRCRDE